VAGLTALEGRDAIAHRREFAAVILGDRDLPASLHRAPDEIEFLIGPLDYFWTAVWVIPTSYPSGSLGYKVVATDSDGHAQIWEPFKSRPSQLTVVPGEIEIKKP
jgi:hypothetical protein